MWKQTKARANHSFHIFFLMSSCHVLPLQFERGSYTNNDNHFEPALVFFIFNALNTRASKYFQCEFTISPKVSLAVIAATRLFPLYT